MVFVWAGCSPPAGNNLETATNRAISTPAPGSNQVFQVKGVIKEIEADGKTVRIRHEEVPNYMPAMVMPFTAKEPKELAGLKAGDEITFRLTVTQDDTWIDQIQKANAPTSATPPTTAGTVTNQSPLDGSLRVVRDLDPLQIGDKLPDYHFTNELGQAVNLAQFQGKALAITFVFTRCPLPNFCPRMSSNFEDAQRQLLAANSTNNPANWQLLTITFDPEFDSPAILKAYAERYRADPKHWSFLTGDPVEISAIAAQFGERFWKEEGALNHNLRTVIIDASGKVQQILQGNLWSADDLVSELKTAAAAK